MVESRDVKFREDVTVERTYINALLKGRQHYYPQIPFIPLPVEYVAEQSVRVKAGDLVRRAANEVASGDHVQHGHSDIAELPARTANVDASVGEEHAHESHPAE
ncbi:hypothetical protein PHYSODRAFT_302699 [Phytophthora sojae]|uniref:Uncharacterized protein n=1 Tax=Phytophthora sojae (strain P6497) TaxID=1094619 RepID=G4ZT26_PHYSP|nr:hypothetical protein PHYSODRAFT_302699 [Phytophthora sojae]EGZ12843.1 hypothetical protein PHYSODRAFT_302699 [Phytophthora sojae]|eukprot:XP_009530272.1 hypothetical protein PHYSODRAFT_302699 [Phytophthora sojae]